MATSEKRVTLIQCTDSKRPVGAQARNLYDVSRYFRKMRAWAMARGNDWFILSAKHGLLSPSETVSPYNERGISESQAEQIASELDERGVTHVDVTAGRDYTDPLVPALEARGIDVTNHFAGLRIGKREKKLAHATQRLLHDP